MNPRQIIIKSMSKEFLDLLDYELSNIPSIRYHYHKFNSFYTITIKCSAYYSKIHLITPESFYGSYIYLYTTISLLLSSLIISHHEYTLTKRIIHNYYFYFDKVTQEKILHTAESMLTSTLPISINQNLYISRKEVLFNSLLKNFRKCNYIVIDSFINFSIEPYIALLENIVDKSVELSIANISYYEIIKFFLEDWLR